MLVAAKDELPTDDLADLFGAEFRRETDRLRRDGPQGDEGALARLASSKPILPISRPT